MYYACIKRLQTISEIYLPSIDSSFSIACGVSNASSSSLVVTDAKECISS